MLTGEHNKVWTFTTLATRGGSALSTNICILEEEKQENECLVFYGVGLFWISLHMHS